MKDIRLRKKSIPLAEDFMASAKAADEPFFVWLNTSRMHLYTRLNDEWRYAAEEYTTEADYHGSGMLQHDHDIGLVLDWLKAAGPRREYHRLVFDRQRTGASVLALWRNDAVPGREDDHLRGRRSRHLDGALAGQICLKARP